jgi:alpha-mannosidase
MKIPKSVSRIAWLSLILGARAALGASPAPVGQPDPVNPVPLPALIFVVPNFHPASCGWLANWSVERNYCANSYLAHLDRVRDDPNYAFVLSECNNLIAIRNFQPARFAELRERIRQGRVELPNAFFLEPTINLSGGEALAKMGIEGLRWQQRVMGVRPRYAWTIDVCGTHAQMPQLCSLLGLDAMVYTRCSRADKTAFWSESPDGTRLLTLVPGGYAETVGGMFSTRVPLGRKQLGYAANAFTAKIAGTPAGAPVLILAGIHDYSLPPPRPENPTESLVAWRGYRPDCEIRYTCLSPYVDTLMAGVRSGAVKLDTIRGGTGYTFDSFWIENPAVKQGYRRDEHALQSAEMLGAIASLEAGYAYPVQPLYQAWLQMLLNMDRNTLWGSAGGMVFESKSSWDASDRFAWVERESAEVLRTAAQRLAGPGPGVGLFNSANWTRTDPLRLRLPGSAGISGAACESAGDGTVFCRVDVPGSGVAGVALDPRAAAVPRAIPLPEVVETRFYSAKIDPATGALVSLRTKPSGREMLGGPANVVIAERHVGKGDAGDRTDPRPNRPRLASSSDFKTTLTVTDGPLAVTVEARGAFYGGGPITRVTRFFKDYPRIEFETELNDIPNLTVVVAEFPLARAPAEIRRGIPFGFSRDDGLISGIVPAVRWSDYSSPGEGGVALLDRGVTGREINGRVPVIYLLNTSEDYYGFPNRWLGGKGRRRLEYALVAHDGDWAEARVPQLAWEYNDAVTVAPECRVAGPRSFAQTSDNVIVEALRRDGPDVEMRLVEALGQPGVARVRLDLPYEDAALTDLTGGHAQSLGRGPALEFPVRPQQIVTLRFRTARPVAEVEPLLEWDALVPPAKQAALHTYLKDKKGLPPRGS